MMDIYEQGLRRPKVCQIRPNSIVFYNDPDYYTHNRKGKTACLRQNQIKTDHWYEMFEMKKGDLLKCEIIKETDSKVNNWAYQYWMHYKRHAREVFDKMGIRLRALGELSRGQIKQINRITDCIWDTVQASKKRVKRYKYGSKKWREQARTTPYIAFVTLTLASEQIHQDKVIRRMYAGFSKDLRRYGVVNSIGKMEAQENGNAHFHLIIDRFMDKKEVNDLWNKHQNKYGYVDRFEKKHGHRNPPTTKIETPKKRYELGSYLLKNYIKKNQKKGKKNAVRPIVGQVWFASNKAKKLDYYKVKELDPDTGRYYQSMVNLTYKKEQKVSKKTGKIDLVDAVNLGFWDNLNDYVAVYNGNVYKYIKGAFWGRLMKHYREQGTKLTNELEHELQLRYGRRMRPKPPPKDAKPPSRKHFKTALDDHPPPLENSGVNSPPLVAI